MDRKVTAIKAQIRNRERVNVFLDETYAFSLQRVTAAWLQVGQILSEEKIANLQRQDGEEVAFQKALKLISHRMRSEAEIVRKLHESGYDDLLIAETVTRLRSEGMLNDERFTQNWVEDRVALHPRSRRMMTLELRHKGISEENIQTALSQLSSEEELAYELTSKRIRHYQDLDWRQFRTRLGSFLGRKGFSYDTIDVTLKRVWSENHEASVMKSEDEEMTK